MRVFNEESNKAAAEIMVLLKRKEAISLIDVLTEACKNRPKKLSWKRLLKELVAKAGVY